MSRDSQRLRDYLTHILDAISRINRYIVTTHTLQNLVPTVPRGNAYLINGSYLGSPPKGGLVTPGAWEPEGVSSYDISMILMSWNLSIMN